MKPYFPDIFETQLRQKYHSAKITEIKSKKRSSSILSEKRKSLSSKKLQPKILQERKIALQNIQMIKRLAQLKYGSSQIKKLWGSTQKQHLKSHKKHENVKQERQRLVENERLGKVIEQINKRKKNYILPDD